MPVICLWSGPRNVSTALMYSFAERPDTTVVDEPLYGHFLRVTGTIHPGRDEVLASVNCDGDAVMAQLLQYENAERPVLFLKQMAHHLVGTDNAFLQSTLNVFLIRDPAEMLPSLTIQMPHATLADTGLKHQWEMVEMLQAMGQHPAVVDSRRLLLDPPGVLQALCTHLNIEYTDGMLSWPAGTRPEDGVWAKHWYHSVHESTGFAPYSAKGACPAHLATLLAECQPWYDKLSSRAIESNSDQ